MSCVLATRETLFLLYLYKIFILYRLNVYNLILLTYRKQNFRPIILLIYLWCLIILFFFVSGSHLTRLREARRLQRLQWLASPVSASVETTVTPPCPPQVDKTAQNRVILELAWKTIALMHKNRLIQQKIIALQKETSEFVASVMNNPENRQRYLEHVRLHTLAQAQAQVQTVENKNLPLKLEPKV